MSAAHQGGATANFKNKEKTLFNDMLAFYDNKQYKQSLRNADKVLEKHPDHPETLAMQALNLNAQKKKKEAFEYIKKALFKNMANFTCWHVYGILNRSNKNYDDARKAYLNALKYDPNNQNVLRDLGQLQIQLRDYEGYAESRRQILVAKPTMQGNWITYAVALYLCKNYQKALEVLQSFEKTLRDDKAKLKKHERNELTLFEAKILEDSGDCKKAIDVLSKKGNVANQVTLHETLTRNYMKVGNKDKAIESLEELLQLNNSNYAYYYKILEAHGFTKGISIEDKYSEDDQAKIQELFEEFEKNQPKATSHQRIQLKLLHGDRFKNKLWQYAKPHIIKGVPPMIIDLKELYADADKVKAIEELLLTNLQSMTDNNRLIDDPEDVEQDPTIMLWLLYFTAQHYYFLRNFSEALNFVEKARLHTPTVIEIYMLKAKIYKRAGDLKYASTLYDEARKLDLADRYLNAVSSRYKIRIDDLQDAENTMGLFSKEDANGDLNVHDMQCMWYENEFGDSYLRQKNYILALKNYNFIEKHFDQIIEDQFDFHLYAIRKFTLNSYFEMIDMEDNLYRNKYAVRASIGIIKVMRKVVGIKDDELNRIRPEMKEYKESKEYQKVLEELRKKDDDDDYKNDPDPKGYDYYEKCLKDPNAKALEVATLIAKYNPDSKEVQAKVIPVFLQNNKILLALKAVICLQERHPTYEKTLPMKLRLVQYWLSQSEESRSTLLKDERLQRVVEQEIAALNCPTSISDLEALGEEFLKQNSSSMKHVHEYVKLRMKLFNDQNAGAKFEEIATNALTQDANKNDKIGFAENMHRRIVKAGGAGNDFKAKAKQLFKYAKYFQDDEPAQQ